MATAATTKLIRRLINGAGIASYGREHTRFTTALECVEVTQRNILTNLLRQNADTRIGRRHSFARIRSTEEYQARVPVIGYEAITAEVEAISQGEPNVLTTDRVKRFQPTSGSTSVSKLIPWTTTVAQEFQRGIAPWLYSLYRRTPSLLNGSAYWSISPPTSQQTCRGQLPIGFDHDAAYLGLLGRHLFDFVSTVPAKVAQQTQIDTFKDQTLAALLADDGLALISIWSPTFLTVLLNHFLARRDTVLALVAGYGSQQAHRRSEELRDITRNAKLEPEWIARVWPNLRVISCWNHGPSELHAAQLQALFPKVEIQGKGLISTEAFVSLPFETACDPVLAVRSHFFEFKDHANGTFHLAHQLERERIYSLVITTGGGLYRYALGDLVQVSGFIKNAPCLRFLGREGNFSDQVGEKLNGLVVHRAVSQSLALQNITAKFFLLAPVASENGLSYVLFLETNLAANVQDFPHILDQLLRENFHYDHCRRLGQLAAPRVFLIDPTVADGAACYHAEMSARGLKLGDIKLVPLDSKCGWEQRFRGHFIAQKE